MKNDVLIVKNITHENPGLISELLYQVEIKYNIINYKINIKFDKSKDIKRSGFYG